MKILFVAILATSLLAPRVTAQEPLRLGEFQNINAGHVHYDAFVPEQFDPAGRWPLLLIASDDPRIIARFQLAASRYGYVVTRAATVDARAVWDDARKRFRTNPSRSYLVLAGRNAGRIDFSELSDVSGLAAINTVPRNMEAPTVFFSFGVLDTSYIELKQLSRITGEQRRRVGSDMFDGTELDAAAATRIVEWLHLDALDQGIAVVTDDHIAGIVSNWTSTAQALETTDPLRAVSMYNVIVANFSSVTAQARSRSNQVASSLSYSRAEYSEGRALRWEAAQKKKIVTSTRTPPATVDAFFKTLDFKALRTRAAGKDGAMKNAATRLLRYLEETAAAQEVASPGVHAQFWKKVAERIRSTDGIAALAK